MLVIRRKRYLRSLKRILASGRVANEEIEEVVNLIAGGGKLPSSYNEHLLVGDLAGYYECHIRPDLLLIYKVQKEAFILQLVDIGSHSQLFG